MYPRRFAHPNNHTPHQNPWRPHGPRFRPVWPMQQHKNNYTTGHSSPNNNENHWCETCDRGFRTLEILLNHKQQHQKCNIDGCQFVAHPKVITKHIQMQHSTGLFKKIAKLNNPEEIQKWKEERKKRYPTKENIEKRNAENKEKIDRGEKMNMKNHRENKFNGRDQGIKRKHSHDNNRTSFKRRYPPNKSTIEVNNKPLITDNRKTVIPPRKENKMIPQMDNSKSLKPFAGIQNLLDDIINDNDDVKRDLGDNDSIEEDHYIVMDGFEDKSNSNTTEPVVCGALSLLIGNYESSDDEDGSTNKSSQLQHNQSQNLKDEHNDIKKEVNLEPTKQLDMNINVKNDSEKSDDDSGPEEADIVKDINSEMNTDGPSTTNAELCKLKSSKKEGRERQERNRTNNTKNVRKIFKPKLPSTLLEKLLRSEIRQERNIVLQCIRYIVKNNYFEK